MGFLARFAERLLPQCEQRDVLGSMLVPAGTDGIRDPDDALRLSPHAPENLAAVLAAVNAISSAVAGLTPLAFRVKDGNRTEIGPSHWLTRVLRAPNDKQSWHEFVEAMVGECLLRGNALAEIKYDEGGRVTALEPISWRFVSVVVLPSGRIAFDIAPHGYGVDMFAVPRRDQPRRRLFAEECLWLRDRLDAGEVVARSRLQRAGEALGNAKAVQDLTSAAFRNSSNPSIAYTVPTILKPGDRTVLRTLLDGFTGVRNVGKYVMLEGDCREIGGARPEEVFSGPFSRWGRGNVIWIVKLVSVGAEGGRSVGCQINNASLNVRGTLLCID